MIAAGLCMMGGCFAQDASSRAVDTYWPTHSVHVEQKIVRFLNPSEYFCCPCIAETMRAGARVENIYWNTQTENLGLLSWGYWGVLDGTSYEDAAYLSLNWITAGKKGPLFVALQFPVNNQIPTNVPISSPVAYTEVQIEGLNVDMQTNLGNSHGAIVLGESSKTPWELRIRADRSAAFDVVSYWWYDEGNTLYFMIQPLRAIGGEYAFFMHGFNKLFEI